METTQTTAEKPAHFTTDKISSGNFKHTLNDSLSALMQLYVELHVQGSSAATFKAKVADLKMFMAFFEKVLGSDLADLWTPAVTKAFQKSLAGSYMATSINRVFATLRHFCSFLEELRPLACGTPFAGVADLVTDDPDWNGLMDRQILLLKNACHIRVSACTKKNQNPLLETAIFYTLLYTGLREGELASLVAEQYYLRGFHQVRRKGKKITRKISVPLEAREWIDKYLESRSSKKGLSSLLDSEQRGLSRILDVSGDAPLFANPKGGRISERGIRFIMERLSEQASAHLPDEEKFHCSPHMLRHTFLKRVADKHGVHTAQELSGNVSTREVWRYTRPSQEEKEKISEEVFD